MSDVDMQDAPGDENSKVDLQKPDDTPEGVEAGATDHADSQNEPSDDKKDSDAEEADADAKGADADAEAATEAEKSKDRAEVAGAGPDPDDELKDIDDEVMEEPQNNPQDDEDEDEDDEKQPAIPPPPSLLRKDKSLKEFLNTLDDNAPIIPDAVTDYYLAKSGFETSDRRIKRLLALATQKFVSDIASDAYQYSRIRSSSSVATSSNPQARARALASGGAGAAASSSGGGSNNSAQPRAVLTMDDLGNALADYGLNVKRPDFYR